MTLSRMLAGRKAWMLATAAVAAIASPAYAQVTRNFDIPAQPLAAALEAFGKQSGMEILFDRGEVAGKTSARVSGSMAPAEALARLTGGAGLSIRQANASTFVVSLGPRTAVGSAAIPPAQVSEVTVTGTHLREEAGPARPVNVYNSDVIAQSGQVRLETFLNSLPEVSVSAAGNGFTRYAGQAGVRLRGLPDGTTAILLDGRRTPGTGLSVLSAFDINTIPLAMIDRIDVVPIGSSAVYGSDAIGGVVNVILKKRFDGLDLSADYSFADAHEERSASVLAGKAWSSGGLAVGLAYHDQDGLRGTDRPLTASNDFRRFSALGGADVRFPYCMPGNVTAVRGTLNGLSVSTAAIPATGADKVANYTAGQQNTCSYFSPFYLVTPSTRLSGMVTYEQEIGEATLYGSIFGSRVRNDVRLPYAAVAGQLVPAANPFNPFGQDVIVTTALPYENGTLLKTTVTRGLVGLRGQIGANWDWDVSAWASFMHDDADEPLDGSLSAALTPILASTDRATGINLFDPRSNSATSLERVRVRTKNVGHSKQEVALGILRGTPFALPAGAVQTASGFEVRYEGYTRRTYPNGVVTFTGGDRRVWALFTEAMLPLIGPAEEGAPPRLEASLAGRYDQYSDFGGRFSPQLGLTARLTPSIQLGATYSESFKAPGLGFMYAKRIVTPNSIGLIDPVRKEGYPVTLISGGNVDLLPETGKSWSGTVSWDSQKFPGLKVRASYWAVGMDDRVGSLGYQTILNNESLFPGRVVREPDPAGRGKVISVDNTFANFGSIRVRGLDLHASYAWTSELGEFTPSVALSRMLEYKSQLQPNRPYVNNLSRANFSDAWAPRLKATVGLGWRSGETRALLQGRYVGRYLDYQTPANGNMLGNDWYLDGSLQAPLSLDSERLGKDLYLRISATNLLDKGPEYSNFNSGIVGYDPLQADLVGRTVTIGIGARF